MAGGTGGSPKTSDYPLVLRPMDRDFGWRDEPKFHSVASHFQHRNCDAIADDDLFSPLAAENQHLYSLPAIAFFDRAGHGIAPRSWTRNCMTGSVGEVMPLATPNCHPYI
jgi:hypothetical protein